LGDTGGQHGKQRTEYFVLESYAGSTKEMTQNSDQTIVTFLHFTNGEPVKICGRKGNNKISVCDAKDKCTKIFQRRIFFFLGLLKQEGRIN
jgi:hypothetical protein